MDQLGLHYGRNFSESEETIFIHVILFGSLSFMIASFLVIYFSYASTRKVVMVKLTFQQAIADAIFSFSNSMSLVISSNTGYCLLDAFGKDFSRSLSILWLTCMYIVIKNCTEEYWYGENLSSPKKWSLSYCSN